MNLKRILILTTFSLGSVALTACGINTNLNKPLPKTMPIGVLSNMGDPSMVSSNQLYRQNVENLYATSDWKQFSRQVTYCILPKFNLDKVVTKRLVKVLKSKGYQNVVGVPPLLIDKMSTTQIMQKYGLTKLIVIGSRAPHLAPSPFATEKLLNKPSPFPFNSQIYVYGYGIFFWGDTNNGWFETPRSTNAFASFSVAIMSKNSTLQAGQLHMIAKKMPTTIYPQKCGNLTVDQLTQMTHWMETRVPQDIVSAASNVLKLKENNHGS